MGIKQLSRLISETVPAAIIERKISHYFNRIIAIDASMCLYQFLISIRSDTPVSSAFNSQLTNSQGKVTSHLSGMFYRTIKLLENGIKPIYVFDGAPPAIKKHEIDKRRDLKEQAERKLQDALKKDDQETARKMAKRSVRVSKEETEDTKRLLRLMGVPVVQAPGEAEAQCAVMCRQKLVYGVATEDMDALTFGAPVLVRNMLRRANNKDPALEYRLDAVLSGAGLSMGQFIDVCILSGCDYAAKIKGIGPFRALELIKKHGSIERLLEKETKFGKCEDFEYKEARKFFLSPDVENLEGAKLKWADPDEKGLLEFMVGECEFAADRIKSGILRMHKAKSKGGQTRMDDFFSVVPEAKSGGAKGKTPKRGIGKAKGKKSGVVAKGKKIEKKVK